MQLDWSKLRLFELVVEAGSFTEAARRLHMSQPAVSRQVSALETSLGAKLFHRHARGLALTHEGEQLHEATREMSERVDRVQLAIETSRDRPSGELRLATTVSFGSTWLARRMKEFLDLYPDIRVRLVLADEESDLSRREADCAVRFHAPHQTDLVRKALAPVRYRLCASEEYLARRGEPATLAELEGHRLLAYGASAPDTLRNLNWLVETGGDRGHPREPELTINNVFGLLHAVESGAGIAALPGYLLATARGVRTILPEAATPVFRTYFVYPSELRRSMRVAAMRDFLSARMASAAL
jgi:DNA-binding transcriptional LysR family regulator